MKAFQPQINGTVTLSSSNSSTRVQLPRSATSESNLELANNGSEPVYIEIGNLDIVSTVPNGATGGGYPLQPNSVKVITRTNKDTHIAAITASGTVEITVSAGIGV